MRVTSPVVAPLVRLWRSSPCSTASGDGQKRDRLRQGCPQHAGLLPVAQREPLQDRRIPRSEPEIRTARRAQRRIDRLHPSRVVFNHDQRRRDGEDHRGKRRDAALGLRRDERDFTASNQSFGLVFMFAQPL